MHVHLRPPLRAGLIFAGLAAWGLILVSCVTTDRAVIAPPQIAGAKFVGSKQCADCHGDITDHFATASHARLKTGGPGALDTSCENCHGPGSLHVKAGGGAGTIINPRKSPDTCFQCHLDKRGQFSLPHSHPVLAGKMSCGDCHDPHTGSAVRGSGAALAASTDTCVRCHTQQAGPFTYPHGAIREEGCTACHNPHGTVNDKMLLARDANLCLRCHLAQLSPGFNIGGFKTGGAHGNSLGSRLSEGTCWSGGCHEDIHGSNVNASVRP
ncbi:MAG TPA: cytochrome c3 family protein [Opitutaceae bacterium]|nr:cytochrome c3 family protein [Opitutaceae bacterium]